MQNHGTQSDLFYKSLLAILVASVTAMLFAGCHVCPSKKWWEPPTPAKTGPQCQTSKAIADKFFGTTSQTGLSSQLGRAEVAYAAARADRDMQKAVDHYYEALVFSWMFVCQNRNNSQLDLQTDRAWDVYHSSLASLITVGQKSGRLNFQQGLLVRNPSGMELIPIRLNEFNWPPNSFNKVIPVGGYHDENILHQYRGCGLGVPLVAIQNNQCGTVPLNQFFFQQTPFAATGVLYPNLDPWINISPSQQTNSSAPGLTLYDPQKVPIVQYDNASFRLAADVTAPLAYLGQQTDWNPLEEFARPETDPNLAGLRMLEPYQAEKIPILFVHGLFSDPQTYLEMANRIRACPELAARYQIWVFRYPTGGNFFMSAAKLRRQLATLIAECEKKGGNTQLRQMVIVGHSLGGLVAKLQVTQSNTTLWDSVACVPFNQIVASPEACNHLREELFFTPSPYIKTAIFIAMPNEGSPWAKRPVGRLASKMVKYSPQQTAAHRELIEQNPGVFSDEIQKRIPTSVDLMNPDNRLLQAMQRIPIAPWVQSYAIAGTGGSSLSRMGPSDGVITLHSATTPLARQTFYVNAVHTDILRNPRTIDIVAEILRCAPTQTP